MIILPSVNYNRDLELFPVLKKIIEKITGKESIYQSPTDMGVNRVGYGIIDDEVVAEASRQEIIRRYFKTAYEILDYLGFKYVCLFEKRKCKFIKVEKDIIHSA